MKRFYTYTGAKLLAFFLAAVLAIAAVLFSCSALNFAIQGCIPGQAYENSAAYRNAISDYVISAANLYRMEGEDVSPLSFVEQQERTDRKEALQEALSAEQSNFRYQILSADGKDILYSNLSEGESFESLGVEVQYATVQDDSMVINLPADYRYYFSSGTAHLFFNDAMTTLADFYEDHHVTATVFTVQDVAISPNSESNLEKYANLLSTSAASYILRYGVLPDYPVSDTLSQVLSWYRDMMNKFPVYIMCAVLCALFSLVCLVFLCCGAGRRKNSDGVTMRLFDRIPFELVLTLLIFAGALGSPIAEDIIYSADAYGNTALRIFTLGGYLCYLLVLTEIGILTTAVRIKARAFWRHTLLGRLVGLCSNMVNHLDVTWKCVLFYLIYEFISFLFFSGSSNPGLFFLFAILNFFLLLAGCRWAVKFGAVRAGAAELAKGNLEYRINTLRLPHTLKEHANDLNHISEGMSAAVEERMKSERLKSELITNVSHDIKTPLTSIINYVDLIQAEQIDNPKVLEYLAVLDRQSKRLKKLTNDLVEASKASSGAIQVHYENVDACELLQQATGEYSERLAGSNLTPVFSLPEHPVYIKVDGALLWRVIDNLLSNICKYALPGTRVYLGIESSGETMTISAKNVSKAALNIPPDELMERFVRGDSSRNSEGSGLGLSIARSLTTLMGGTFDLEIDGDLFKAKISFPIIDTPQK